MFALSSLSLLVRWAAGWGRVKACVLSSAFQLAKRDVWVPKCACHLRLLEHEAALVGGFSLLGSPATLKSSARRRYPLNPSQISGLMISLTIQTFTLGFFCSCLASGCRGKENHPSGLWHVRGTRPKGPQGPQPAHGRGAQDRGHHGTSIFSGKGFQGYGKASPGASGRVTSPPSISFFFLPPSKGARNGDPFLRLFW